MSAIRALLPFDRGTADGVVLPLGADAGFYDGTGPVPGNLSAVEFFVPPHPPRAESVKLIGAMPRLRVVQTLSVGVDHLTGHLPAGVVLCNGRGLHESSTAELAVGLIIAAQRNLPYFIDAQNRGEWLYEMGEGLAGRTVIVVGHGGIGRGIERRLTAFDARVMFVARTARPPVLGAESLMSMLPRADVVVLAVPLTPQTTHLADRGFLRQMRDGALLVNVSRGAVVDTGALVSETCSGRLRAALDVVEPEPLPAGHPLWTSPGVIITPHVGAASSAFLAPAWRLICDQLARYLAGIELRNQVTDLY